MQMPDSSPAAPENPNGGLPEPKPQPNSSTETKSQEEKLPKTILLILNEEMNQVLEVRSDQEDPTILSQLLDQAKTSVIINMSAAAVFQKFDAMAKAKAQVVRAREDKAIIDKVAKEFRP